MSLLVFYLWMLTRHPQIYMWMCISRWQNLRNIQNLSLCLWNTALPCGVHWLLHGQKSAVSSQFVSLCGGYEYPPELCPCGCAALPFHLEGSYSSLSHVHSVMHTARETLKNHRCLPQNLPHLTSWQCGQCCQCPQQTVLSYPARGQSQILLFCSGLTLLEFFLSPTFSELLTRKAINSPGWWSWLCYHHCAWYKDRLNQLLMGLSGTDEGTQKVT